MAALASARPGCALVTPGTSQGSKLPCSFQKLLSQGWAQAGPLASFGGLWTASLSRRPSSRTREDGVLSTSLPPGLASPGVAPSSGRLEAATSSSIQPSIRYPQSFSFGKEVIVMISAGKREGQPSSQAGWTWPSPLSCRLAGVLVGRWV